jgi:hypothetical protein
MIIVMLSSGWMVILILSSWMIIFGVIIWMDDNIDFTCLPQREAWWLNGSMPDCCPTVPGSNLASPQPTADCQSPGGLPPRMALGCGLTSVRGNRGENYEK